MNQVINFLVTSFIVALLSISSPLFAAESESVMKSKTKKQANTDTDTGSDSDNKNVITITADRLFFNANQHSSSVTEINESHIKLISAEHINQVLKQVPSTWISRGNGQEHLTAIRSPVFTGAGACGAFFMAEDWISLRAPGFCNLNQLFDVNSEQSASIEVIRGTGSTLFGTNAVHGIVNVLTPDAFDDSADSADYFSIEAGDYGYFRSLFSVTDLNNISKDNRSATRVYANFTNDTGYQNDSGFEQQKINVIHQTENPTLSTKSLVSLANLNQQTAGYIQGIDAYKDQLIKRQNPNPEAYRNSLVFRAYSKLNWQLDESSQLAVTPYLRYTKMDFLQHFLPWQPTEKNGHYSFGLKNIYTKDNNNSQWYAGFDLEYTQGELIEEQSAPFAPTIPQGSHYDYDVTAKSISPFVASIWSLDKLMINLGLRYNYIQYDYKNNLSDGSACDPAIINCRFYRPENQSRRFSHWSPKLGLNYQFNNAHYFYTELTRGFRAPQATELFRLQAGQQYSDIQTEEIDSFQMGMKGQVNDVSYELSLYHLNKNNYIFLDSNRFVVSNGETSHQGLELALEFKPSEQWTVAIASSYGKHLYENDIQISNTNIQGNLIDTAPKNMTNAQVTWQPDEALTWSLEWDYLGDYYLNPENTASYDGHHLFNLRAQIKLKDSQISIKVINLNDADYAERADFGFGQYRYFVGRPRGLFVSYQYWLD